MSVYTSITADQLKAFLQCYNLGELSAYSGISNGIENTNFLVDTQSQGQQKRFVLTIFEQYSLQEMPYFLNLMQHLNRHGVPGAKPIANRAGELLMTLKEKPAALIEYLPGQDLQHPSSIQIEKIADAMAHLHIAGKTYKAYRANCRDLQWSQTTRHKLVSKLSTEDVSLLDKELEYQQQIDTTTLPSGIIHADLFRDNALFDGDTLTGIIDFYFACNDVFLYDIAVAINDWCRDREGRLDWAQSRCYLQAYQHRRPMTENEHDLFWPMLRRGALRFWLSRLRDLHFPKNGEMTHQKDPGQFKTILQQCIHESSQSNQGLFH